MNVLDTVTETVDHARRRLAEKARQEGVTLSLDDDGRWYASSVSTPGTRHYLTAYSCTCVGFCNRGRCKHNSALLACLGWLDLDDDPEPTPPAPMAITLAHTGAHDSLATEPDSAGAALPDCGTCHDAGLIDAPRSRWVGGSRFGFRDTWATVAPCPRCQPVAA
jgi:cytochrome c553